MDKTVPAGETLLVKTKGNKFPIPGTSRCVTEHSRTVPNTGYFRRAIRQGALELVVLEEPKKKKSKRPKKGVASAAPRKGKKKTTTKKKTSGGKKNAG